MSYFIITWHNHELAKTNMYNISQLHAYDALLLELICDNNPETNRTRLADMNSSAQQGILDRASIHRALELLCLNLREAAEFERDAQQRITDVRRTSQIMDLKLSADTALVDSAMQQEGISTIVYKGAVTSRMLSMPQAIKISGDIDLIVHEEDVKKAAAILFRLGYECKDIDGSEAAFLSDTLTPVDLHWSQLTVGSWSHRLSDYLRECWDNCAHVRVHNATVRTFSPTDSIAVLALHAGCHHLCADWTNIYELAECTKKWKDEIDWERLTRVAENYGFLEAILFPLKLASDYFSACIPSEFNGCNSLQMRRHGIERLGMFGFRGDIRSPLQHRFARAAWNVLLLSEYSDLANWIAQWAKLHASRKRLRSALISGEAETSVNH